MAAGNQQKHLEFFFSIKALSSHSRTGIRAHKHLILEMVKLLKIKRRDFFPTRRLSYFGVTHCENSEVQKGQKKFFGDRLPPAYLKVWMTAPPPLPLISRSGGPHPPPPNSPLSQGLDDGTPHSPLSQGLDDRTPPPPLPPYLKVWIRHCITGD